MAPGWRRSPASTPTRLRELADTLERRIAADVLYLTVEHIDEVDHDGWVYDFEVPDHHNYVAGGMLAHNTAAMLRIYLNDLRDADAAIIVIDPKSELEPAVPAAHAARLRQARLVPGSRAPGVRDEPAAAQRRRAAADPGRRDRRERRRRAAGHQREPDLPEQPPLPLPRGDRRASRSPSASSAARKFEDVYSLLLPMKEDFRAAVAEACADQPDLDQTAEFFRSELPDDLRMAGSAVAQRLDAPRNKVAGLTGVPPLRRFFNHPTDIALRDIIEARDVLIVDANMGAIGEDNSKACMHFLLRMLHTQMQRQVHLPETDRPRVPLLVDEAHYVAGAENVVDQIATHRRAGLETAFGLQYFAQLGSGSQHEEKIRKGVLNLLQSRFLFRMGDAQDAEQATRIAMAVYATMIRDDPDSRARLRVTPEQALNFPNHHCLASWIAMGARIPSFMGQTYAVPAALRRVGPASPRRPGRRVAPYPDDLESTLDRAAPRAAGTDDDRDAPPIAHGRSHAGAIARRAREHSLGDARAQPSSTGERSPNARAARRRPRQPTAVNRRNAVEPSAPPPRARRKREVRADYRGAARRAECRRQPRPQARGTPGTQALPPHATTTERRRDSLRELAFLDRVNEIAPADQLHGAARLPRLFDEDYAHPRPARPRRAGAALADRPRRAPGPRRHRGLSRLTKLYRHGLIAQHTIGLREHARTDGKPPLLYSITRRGLEVAQAARARPGDLAQARVAGDRAAPRRPAAHDLHALGWAIELHRTVGPLATDNWRTPRYATGRYPVPQVGSGQRRHPITAQRDPGARRPSDHRPRAQDVHARSSPTCRSSCASTR